MLKKELDKLDKTGAGLPISYESYGELISEFMERNKNGNESNVTSYSTKII